MNAAAPTPVFNLADIADFQHEQCESLLSLDESKIRSFVRKWNKKELSDDPFTFWVGVHQIITSCTQLPKEFRMKSKEWLDHNGLPSYDFGDLKP